MGYQEKVEQFMLAGDQDVPLQPTVPDGWTPPEPDIRAAMFGGRG